MPVPTYMPRARGVTCLRHVYESVDGVEKVSVQRLVDQVSLVRFHIVDLAQYLGVSVLAGYAGYRSEARCHERGPVLHQNDVGALAAQPASYLDPRQRVDRRHGALDRQVAGRRRIDRLALAGEQESRVLQCECQYFDLMSARGVLACHGFHYRSQSAAIRVRRTDDRYFQSFAVHDYKYTIKSG